MIPSQAHPFDALAQVKRDRWQRPLIKQADGTEVPYTRASSLGKVLEDQAALTSWKQRMTLVGASLADHIMISVAAHREDVDANKSKLNQLAQQALDAAQAHGRAEIGTALHRLTQTIDEGRDPGPFPAQFVGDVAAYRSATLGWEYAGMEQFVVCDELRVAGSFDRLRRMPDGTLRIVDLKTGSSVDYAGLSFAVQLAIYAHGQVYDPATGQRTPLGDVDLKWGTVVHLPALKAACRIYRVDLEQGWEAAKTAITVKDMRGRAKAWIEPDPDASAPLSDLIAAATTPDHLKWLWKAYQGEFTPELQELAAARHALLAAQAV